NEEMLRTFFEINTFHIANKDGVELELVAERLRGETLNFDLVVGGKVIVEAGKRSTARHVKQLQQANVDTLAVPDEYLYGRILAHDVIDAKTGEVLAVANAENDEAVLAKLRKAGVEPIGTRWVNDLSAVGRMKFNRRVGRKETTGAPVIYDYKYFSERGDETAKNLVSELGETSDIIDVIRTLCEIRNGRGTVDDIDHLGNRRVRSVGEMAENVFRVGLVRVERAVKERLSLAESD